MCLTPVLSIASQERIKRPATSLPWLRGSWSMASLSAARRGGVGHSFWTHCPSLRQPPHFWENSSSTLTIIRHTAVHFCLSGSLSHVAGETRSTESPETEHPMFAGSCLVWSPKVWRKEGGREEEAQPKSSSSLPGLSSRAWLQVSSPTQHSCRCQF